MTKNKLPAQTTHKHPQTTNKRRQRNVQGYFPSAMGIDDFIARLEVVLAGYGFTGDNSICE
jgi:hypothetical protein